MITIQHLQQIDLKKIQTPKLKTQITSILEDYGQATDKEFFISEYQTIMDTVYDFVTKINIDAIAFPKQTPCDDDPEELEKDKKEETSNQIKEEISKEENKAKSESPKKKSTGQKKKKTPIVEKLKKDSEEVKRKVNDTIKKVNAEISECRTKIKKYNEEKRKNEPEKRPPSRYEKIKKHFISIGNLRPDKLKESEAVDQKVQRILSKAHRNILNAYGMNSLRQLQKDQKELKEKLDKNKAA